MFLSVFVLLTYVQKRLRCYVVLEHTQYPHIRISSAHAQRKIRSIPFQLIILSIYVFVRKKRTVRILCISIFSIRTFAFLASNV